MLGVSMGSRPRHTKNFSDFDETYSVCRAFNSKNNGKNAPLQIKLCLKEVGQKYFYHENPKKDVRVSLSPWVF